MAIYKLIRNTVFEPKDIERLVAAYEQTLRALRLKDRDDPITQLVAEKIIAIGRLGIEDPAEISKLTLKELGWVRRSSSRAASPAHLRAQGCPARPRFASTGKPKKRKAPPLPTTGPTGSAPPVTAALGSIPMHSKHPTQMRVGVARALRTDLSPIRASH